MKQSIFSFLLIGLLFYSCATPSSPSIEKAIEDYYQIFNERQEFEKFLDFYAEDIVLEDIINGDRITGKQGLREFYDWSNPNFVSLKENTLVIVERIVDKRKAVVKGYFTAFKWGDSVFEAMHFTSLLTFDDSGKIIKQVDWINYPATLLNYEERKNSNKWIH